VTEELYRELRAVEPAGRWLWLSDRAPGELHGHWWLRHALDDVRQWPDESTRLS